MARQALAGSRIRERRTAAGLRQADLAREVGISASYLNLIEHNRRNVGAPLLRRIAEVLRVDPEALTEGAGAALIAGLREAASAAEAAGPGTVAGTVAGPPSGVPVTAPGPGSAARSEPPELDRLEEFVGRFPGWAGLTAALQGRVARLERQVETLSDRLAHDPTLSDALHDLLSAVTVLRSTASILAETDDLEPEWRARFHGNLENESVRLAEGAEALVAYLDEPKTREAGLASPQEAFEAWLEAQGHHLPELEAGAPSEALIAALVGDLPPGAARLAGAFLRRYGEEAAALPLADFLPALQALGPEPAHLAAHFGVPLPMVLRRLASLPPEAGLGRIGLVACDASGALTFHKAAEGFALPRFGPGCPLWPLYQALSRPMTPIRRVLEMAGRGQRRFVAYAFCEPRHPGGFDGPQVLEALMLVVPDEVAAPAEGGPVQAVGTSCRICARGGCPARREPSILGEDG